MKDILGFENQYALTEDGKLWSYGNRKGANHIGKFIKCSKDKDGYRRATLNNKDGSKKYVRICRIMLETYRPNYNKSLQSNHINGIRDDDRIENLEWVTASENIKHSFDKLKKNQKCSNNNNFKEWGYCLNGETILINNKSVDTWCKENNTSSTVIYVSMKSKKYISKGKFKGYMFFKVGSTGN